MKMDQASFEFVIFVQEVIKYDLISGKVANDKVFKVVDMYHHKGIPQI